MREASLHSQIVVVSWWSNCLGLSCLKNLLANTQVRDIFVIQVGKSSEQCDLFQRYIPKEVTILPYSLASPAEHSRVLQNIVFEQLPDSRGLWFIDHDTILYENFEGWLRAADSWLDMTDHCMAVSLRNGLANGITSPMLWLSPHRWPDDINNFDPIPFAIREESRGPHLLCSPIEKMLPEADTLVRAKELLEQRGRVGFFSLGGDQSQGLGLPAFPLFKHLGGLSLFSTPWKPDHDDKRWVRSTVRRFSQFYKDCPAEWIAIEEPVLLSRLHEYQKQTRIMMSLFKMILRPFSSQ